jgi:hypothetical protein
VSSRLELVNASSGAVCRGHLQRFWCDVVHELQRRLRVSSRLELVNTRGCDVYRWEVQRVWRNVVQ